jgi:hypothetical protein
MTGMKTMIMIVVQADEGACVLKEIMRMTLKIMMIQEVGVLDREEIKAEDMVMMMNMKIAIREAPIPEEVLAA